MDALSRDTKDDLDDGQKIALFDADDPKYPENTRIFFVPLNPSLADTERSELRIYIRSFNPNNIHLTDVEISIQVICNNRNWRMNEGRIRPLVMAHEILRLLNGTDIGFVGCMYFEKDIRIIPYNQYYTGYELIPYTRTT